MDTREREDSPARIQGSNDIHPRALGHVRLAPSKGPRDLAIGCSTYCISANPSSRSNSSARYWGDRQIAGACTRRIFFTSGGGSAATAVRRPRNEAAPQAAVFAGHATAVPFATLVTHCLHGFTFFVILLGRQTIRLAPNLPLRSLRSPPY